MPSEAYIKAAKQGNLQPVTLMSIESVDAIKATYSTANDWAGSAVLTNVTTTEIDGHATIESADVSQLGQDQHTSASGTYFYDYLASPFDSTLATITAPTISWLDQFGVSPNVVFNVYAGLSVATATLRGSSEPVRIDRESLVSGKLGAAYFKNSPTIFTFRNTKIDFAAGEKIYLTVNPESPYGTGILTVGGDDGFSGSIVGGWEVNNAAVDIVKFLRQSATLTTSTIDMGVIPTEPAEFNPDDTTSEVNDITYSIYAGNADPPTVNLGVHEDGDTLGATGYRYYQVTANLSMTGGDRPILNEIIIKGGNSQYKHFSTHPGEPLAAASEGLTAKSVTSLASKIDLIKFATTGEVSAKMHWTREIGDLLATGYLKNKTVKIRDGFRGLPEPDFETIFSGTWYNYSADHKNKVITVKLRDVLKRVGKRKLPEATTHKITREKTTKPLSWTGINGMQIILDIFEKLGVPDRELDKTEFEVIRDGVRAGWNLTRVISEPVEASQLLSELSVTMGVFLVPQPTGLLKPIIYDETAAAVASLDARDMEFSLLDGGQKQLYTRQKIYYNANTAKPKDADDYFNLRIHHNLASEVARNEVAEKEWFDKWGTDSTIAASIGSRFDGWFAEPHYSVSVKQVPTYLGSVNPESPPYLLGIMPGHIVTVDNLELPVAAANYGELTAGAKFLVMGRNYDPSTGGLKLDLYDVQTVGTPGSGVVGTDMVLSGPLTPFGATNAYIVTDGTGPFTWSTTLGSLDTTTGTTVNLNLSGAIGAGTISVSEPGGTVTQRFDVLPPQLTGLQEIPGETGMRLAWSPLDTAQIAEYEIRQGSTWASANFVARVLSTEHNLGFLAAGDHTYLVSAIDVQGRYSGAAASITFTIFAPQINTFTRRVIDNNILLWWSLTPGTFPAGPVKVYQGETFGAAEYLSEVVGTFYTHFEESSGDYTYWVEPLDVFGNAGTPVAQTARIAEPPDYVLRADWTSILDGTLTNALLENGRLLAPVNTSETFAQHFVNNAWSTPQDQIDAGYPRYLQPTLASGSYEEIFDYGAVLPGTVASATATTQVLAGSVTVTPTISISLNGTDWTDYAGVWSVWGENYRYIKVKLDFAASDDTGLIEVTQVRCKLTVKNKTDEGTVSAVSTDGSGTTVTLNKPFVDISSITVSPKGTTALRAVYDFVDVPNPTEFSVYLFDAAGARASGEVSWTARGV